MDNCIRRVISPPKKKILRFLHPGTVVADLGCGPGYFTIPMAEITGSNGRVYAVDSDPKSIQALNTKSKAQDLENIIATYTASAADIHCVPTGVVDFVFANGLLCCMTDHAGAIAEIKRVLKPDGLAYLSVTKVFRRSDRRAVPKEEWNGILSGFIIKESHEGLMHRSAIVSPDTGSSN
jgi:ubiquinone/menaquinone biosynthesis C-methylase UbiE